MKDTFTAASIFNENLQVTEEQYGVTYGKRTYSSLKPEDHWSVAEHAFIIIQTPNMFYRAEIGGRDLPPIETIVNGEKVLTPPNPAFDYVIYDEQHSFCNMRTFNQETIEILGNIPIKDIVNHTWLVPKAKVEALMKEIEADMGSVDLEKKNPISYYAYGNESLKYPGKKDDFINDCLRLTAMLGSVTLSLIQLQRFLKDCNAHHVLQASTTHLCEVTCSGEILKQAIKMATVGIAPFWANIITGSTLEPKKQFPKVHSCATWAAEKLHHLEIDEIDTDLQPSILVTLADKIGYMTTLHVGDAQEIREAGVRRCPQQQEEVDKVMDCAEHVRERKRNLLTTEDHKATRCVITGGSVLIGAIAASKVKDVVAENCFIR